MVSDNEVSHELIERLKARDERFKILDAAIQVEQELQNCRALKIVLSQAGKEADSALEQLVTVPPWSTEKITELQAVVYRARFIGATIQSLLEAGRQAEMNIREDAEIPVTD